MGDREGNHERAHTISVEQIRRVLAAVVKIPMAWSAAVVAGAVVSCFKVTRGPAGHWSVELAVTTTTVVLLSLLWLPALIRVIALTGGGLKTPAGEATTVGLVDILHLVDPELAREALPSVIAAVEQAETTAPREQRAAAHDVRRSLERELERVEPGGPAVELLRAQAREYERLRAQLPPSSDRTLQMNRIVVRVRAAVAKGQISAEQLRALFADDGDGGRVVTLAAWQARPELADFEQLLDAIDTSRSAFEQYHALLVARTLLSGLTADQRQRLKRIMREQRADPAKGILADRSRADLVDGLLDALG